MKRFALFGILCACMSFSCSAQYFNKREALHSFAVFTSSVLEAHGMLYTASTCIDSINDLGNGLLLPVQGLRLSILNMQGDILHDTVYQRIGIQFYKQSNSLLQLPNKDLLLPANGLDTSGPARLVLLCFDTGGSFKWIREYDKPFCTGLLKDHDYWVLNDFKPDGYGHWLMLSTIKCNPTGKASYVRMLLTKLDSSFNVLWHKPYGNSLNNSFAGHLIVEPSSYTMSGSYTDNNRVHKDFTYQAEIFKTDTAGNQQWHWLSDNTRLTNTARGIIHTQDGGYVYCGQGDGYQVLSDNIEFSTVYWYPWIEKIDAAGRSLWHLTVSHYPAGESDLNEITNIKELPNGDIIASGQIISGFELADTADETFGILMHLSADGSIKWKRKYRHQSDTMIYHVYDMKQTADGGFVLAGEALDLYYPYVYPIQRAWLIKVDSNGCASIDDRQCWPVAVVPVPTLPEDAYKIYPNPASGQLHISFSKEENTAQVCSIVDIMGRVVCSAMLTGMSGDVIVNISHLQPGIYLYRITENGLTKASGKIAKE